MSCEEQIVLAEPRRSPINANGLMRSTHLQDLCQNMRLPNEEAFFLLGYMAISMMSG